MAKVTIGGSAIEVGLPNFVALKRAWRYVEAARQSTDPMESVESILFLVAVGRTDMQLPPDNEEGEAELAAREAQLELKLTPAEMLLLKPFLNDLLVEIGLAKRVAPGEQAPAGEGMTRSPSTATSTP